MSEGPLIKQTLLATSRIGSRLFRNNTAVGWTGSKIRKNPDGSLTIFDPRPLRAGLCEGSSDLIGWSVRGQFVAAEIKYGSTRTTPQQLTFVRTVNEAGGIGVIAHSVDEVIRAIQEKSPAAV